MGAQNQKAIDVLKTAILLEKKGYAFYSQVASQAKDLEVKKFFDSMAHDEVEHIRILSEQFKSYQTTGTFSSEEDLRSEVEVVNVLTDKVMNAIKSASYEAAAISAAISMELSAVKLYSTRAHETTDPKEKALYKWLANWEGEHHEDLAAIEKALQEKIWNDNDFWPM